MKSLTEHFRFSYPKYLILVFCLLSSMSFLSCKDSPVSGEPLPEASYNWTSVPVPFDTVYGVFAVDDDNTCFAFSNGLKKIVNGVISPITVQDTSFNWIGFAPYSADSYVFIGNKMSEPTTWVIKTFDNGTYKDFLIPGITNTGGAYIPYFYSKDKFFVFFDNLKKYYLIDNGLITEFNVENSRPQFLITVNGGQYMFCRSTSSYSYDIYKITGAGSAYLRSEPVYGANSDYENIYPLEEDLIKVIKSGAQVKFSYFTESGWENLHSYENNGFSNQIMNIKGKSKMQFFVIKSLDNSAGNLYAEAWNGFYFTKQTNFPAGLTSNGNGILISSNYIDNTIYFYQNFGTRNLIKARYAGIN